MKFTKWPVVIDPACSVITLQQADDQSPGVWKHLFRIQLGEAAPFIQTNETAHVFGPAETFAACEHLFCYNILGRLTTVLSREGREWVRQAVPEEAAGLPAAHPSLRFVFEDDAALDMFLVVMTRMHEAVRNLGLPSPDDAYRMIQILSRAPHPPRRIAVSAEPA